MRLAQGVYTTDSEHDPAAVVKREWHTIVGRLYPGAVITDRSAPAGGPVGGVLYLAHDARARETALQGLTVRARPGAGPLADDIPLPGGLHQASKARALAENSRPTRSREGRPGAGLTDTELADWIDRLCRIDGEQRLRRPGSEQIAGVSVRSAACAASRDKQAEMALRIPARHGSWPAAAPAG